jgi:hypothetical protein
MGDALWGAKDALSLAKYEHITKPRMAFGRPFRVSTTNREEAQIALR